MTIQELKHNIKLNNIPDRLYSLNEGLKPDAYIIFENYSKWEYYYLDERGNQIDKLEFNNSSDAYDYLWSKLEIELKYPPSNYL